MAKSALQLDRAGIRVSLNRKRLIAEPIDTRDHSSLTMTRFIPVCGELVILGKSISNSPPTGNEALRSTGHSLKRSNLYLNIVTQ